MIISASRRTDIPCFYSDWFMERIKCGEVLIRNPMNHAQVSRILLSPETVDCIVFWTKNPAAMLDLLPRLDERGYCYYFQFTLTPYENDIEQGLPKKQVLVDTFKRLSERLGRKRIVWRYDPIFLSESHTVEYHAEQFAALVEQLHDYTESCVFSFYDNYRAVRKTARDIGIREPSIGEMIEIAEHLARAALNKGLKLESCAETIELSQLGIAHSSCIDSNLIEQLTGFPVKAAKDKNQRPSCGCIESVDIGAYNTCTNGCVYCYANHSRQKLQKLQYDKTSPILCDMLSGSETIRDKMAHSILDGQLKL